MKSFLELCKEAGLDNYAQIELALDVHKNTVCNIKRRGMSKTQFLALIGMGLNRKIAKGYSPLRAVTEYELELHKWEKENAKSKSKSS